MLTTLWIEKADEDSQILTLQQILLPQCKPHQKVCHSGLNKNSNNSPK